MDVDSNSKYIFLTRGDNGAVGFTASLNEEETELYEFQDGDRVFFRAALKPGRDVAVEKECTIDFEENEAICEFVPEDTKDMEFKVYRYEVELVTADGEHYTFIRNSPFEIGVEIEK